MKKIEGYFARVRLLIHNLPEANPEKYEEEILSVTRGDLRIRLHFSDKALSVRKTHPTMNHDGIA